jgi:hypothetical protein
MPTRPESTAEVAKPIGLYSRAPKAWRNLMVTVTEKSPKDLAAVAKVSARLRRG